jgi:putative oxidoreductase
MSYSRGLYVKGHTGNQIAASVNVEKYVSTSITNQPKIRLNLYLWIAQGVLAALYAMIGFMKITQPIPMLAAMLIWPGVLPEWFVRFVGTAELAGALGLVLPMVTGIRPRLTQLAALGLVALQVCAMVFHVSRGEFIMLPLNIVLLLVPAFVLWGRRREERTASN